MLSDLRQKQRLIQRSVICDVYSSPIVRPKHYGYGSM